MTSVFEATEEETTRLIGSPLMHDNYGTEQGSSDMATVPSPENKSIKWPQYLAALSATGGALAAGTILGWTSPTKVKLVTDQEYGFEITDDQFSWIGAVFNLGAAVTCFPIGILINIFGRKWTMLGLVVPFIIGWVLLIWAQNFAMFIVGRFILGLAGGAFCVAAPVYTGEISEKQIRGTLGSYFQLMVTIGIFFVYAVGSGVSVQWLSGICAFIPLIFALIFFFMPESPQYLVSKGKSSEATKSLKFLRGKNYDPIAELNEFEREFNDMQANKVSPLVALRRNPTIRALVISIGLMFFQQMSGVNAVIFYVSTIMGSSSDGSDTGLSDDESAMVIGAVQVVATLISTLIVDRLGRRILLLLSSSIMAVCTVLLGVYFYLDESPNHNADNIDWLPIVATSIFIIMFSLGFGPIPWLMVGELFAPDIKGVAGSFAGTFNWLLAFIVTLTFTDLRQAVGSGETFWIFSGITVVGTLFVFFIVPETKGKTLAEIQVMLGDRSN